jgi:hypothetical protein
MPRSDACVFHLVITFGLEANGICGGWRTGNFTKHPGHRGAIRSARQERANTLVSGNFLCDTIANQFPKSVASHREWFAVMLIEMQRPVTSFVHSFFVYKQAVGRRYPSHISKNGAWSRDHMKEEIIKNRLWVKIGASAFNAVSAIRETERLSINAVTEGFDGKPINGQKN